MESLIIILPVAVFIKIPLLFLNYFLSHFYGFDDIPSTKYLPAYDMFDPFVSQHNNIYLDYSIFFC